ncbi:uncharacterized protein [Solanum lycopersicum]|uniref:uncharacterized protein n=1 Tax=Solanum lycopersicum TaxID=4081 RepID=UPI003748E77A
MAIWNRAAIVKLCWDLAQKEDKLWIKWIHAYYLKDQNVWQKRDQASWMIRRIMNAKLIVDQCQPKQGKGVIKHIYDYLRGEKIKPEWRCLLFKNPARPKACFTLWILMNRKLPTVDRLIKWGITLDRGCVMCKRAEESMEHLFIQCQYAEAIWERLLRWINVQTNMPKSWTEFIQWCVKNGKGKSARAQMFKGILAEGVYGLWSERNKRIFEEKRCSMDEVVKRIAYVTIARYPNSITNVTMHRQI